MRFLLIRLIILISPLSSFAQDKGSLAVYFDFDKYDLTKKARSQIDSFVLAEEKNLSIFIFQLNGYCDAIGPDSYNNKLSKQRVAAVKKYLLSKGVVPGNIGDEIGHGKKEPLNENKTEEERQLNRRVEISFFEVVRTYFPGEESLLKKLADTTTIAGTNIILQIGRAHV